MPVPNEYDFAILVIFLVNKERGQDRASLRELKNTVLLSLLVFLCLTSIFPKLVYKISFVI